MAGLAVAGFVLALASAIALARFGEAGASSGTRPVHVPQQSAPPSQAGVRTGQKTG
jgi:hypothetical protein